MAIALPDAELEARVTEIVEAHREQEGPLLPILHDVQAQLGFVPEPAIPLIAELLNLTRAEVFGVVSFYHDFRTEPAGRHVVKLCRAEACQARGGVALADHLKTRLGVEFGQTSADGAVTLEAVYCLGLCSVAPAAMVDESLHGRLDAARADAVLKAVGR